MIKDSEYNETLLEDFELGSDHYFPGLQFQLLHIFSVTLGKLFIYLLPYFLHLLIGNNINTSKIWYED